MNTSKKALIVIDPQNDYFSGGAFPLWNADATLANILEAMVRAGESGIPVILVRHVADGSKGVAPFFNAGTCGVELHAAIQNAAGDARIVTKAFADSFLGTELEAILDGYGTEEILVCGMMTQNCVTHTAISKSAEKYRVTVLADCCATVSEIIHVIALSALSPRVRVVKAAEGL